MRRTGLLALAIAAACNNSFSGDDPVPVDAGTGDGSADDGDTRSDGGSDAAEAGPTSCVVAQPFSATGWQFLGDATLSGTTAILTPLAQDKKGGVAWGTRHSFGRMNATYQIRIKHAAGESPADGLAFVFVDSKAPPTLGAGGLTWGACQLPGGYAVVVDTDPDQPGDGMRLKLVSVASPTCLDALAFAPLGDLANGEPHTVQVDANAGTIRVDVDGATVLTHTIAGWSTYEGWFGFTAATGVLDEEAAVISATIAFPTEPPCP